MSGTAALEAVSIRKVYPGTVALNGVTIRFLGGEVHAVIGKNGAGKSSLIRILAGAVQPSSGIIRVHGRALRFRSPRDAAREGIATVYQELSLAPDLTVGENILLGRMPTKWAGLSIDRKAVRAEATRVLGGMNVSLDIDAKAGRLGVAEQQVVEIAKAMVSAPSVLMLDEPTSALAHGEKESLFRLVRDLAARGVAVVYISHRLQELQEIAGRVSVLRDGDLIGTISIEEATPATVAHMMFGETVQKTHTQAPAPSSEPVLEVDRLWSGDRVQGVSFTVHKGEVLGVAGLLGSGRTELLRAIAGADRIDAGVIRVQGREVRRPDPRKMKRLGIGLTPENRKEQGLVLPLTIRENLCLASLDRIAFKRILWRSRERAVVDRIIRKLGIAVSDPEHEVSTLSGGNQQKVVVGKWLNTAPKVLLFDEPTRGVDVQAKEQIFQIMRDLSRRGIACVFVSSELEELLEVCHRILIMQRGRFVGEVLPAEVSAKELFQRCLEPAAAERLGTEG
jgi:ribose transport system ATP-binding protein